MAKRKKRTRAQIRKSDRDIARRTRKGVEETFNPPADPATKAIRSFFGIGKSKKKRKKRR